MRSFLAGAIALISAATLSACTNALPSAAGAPSPGSPGPSAVASTGTPAAPEKTTAPARSAAPAKSETSDVSDLEDLGITLDAGVLLDVADDGQDRYLQIGGKSVDFTGTTRTDSTMMALKAAPVRAGNRVLIKPPFWNEDLGPGSCVADTTGAALKLEPCRAGRPAQVWEVRPAGDSGQFELHGVHGVLTVDNGRITTNGRGRTGLQTIPYAG